MKNLISNFGLVLATAVFAVSMTGTGTSRAAEGLGVLPDSAGAIGKVGGRLANLDDPSTLRTNPANMVKLSDPELLVNFGFWEGDIDFSSRSGGDSVSLLGDWKYFASAYLVVPLGEDFAFGLGLSTPFGLDLDFPDQSSIRYAAPHEEFLAVLDLSPALAWRINDALSVGVGLDIMYSELKLRQFFPWSAVTGSAASPDGEFVWDSDGWGLGGFGGVNWEFAPGHRIALTGHLPVKIDYEGDFTASHFPSGLEAAGFSRSSDFESQIEFPGSLGAGYGVDLTERLTAGVDFRWIFNSSHDDLPLSIGNNQGLLGGAEGLDLDWRDSYDLGLGLEYQLSEAWALRGGYLYSSSPFRARTYIPNVPSNDRHLFSVGIGYEMGRHRIDLAYTLMHFPDLTVEGNQQPAFDGDYDFDWNVLSLSYGIKF